jgi:hypothetical protein
MASYQDIDIRLKTVESKLDFIMNMMYMKAMVPSKVLDSAGNPTVNTVEGTANELYRLASQLGAETNGDVAEEVSL